MFRTSPALPLSTSEGLPLCRSTAGTAGAAPEQVAEPGRETASDTATVHPLVQSALAAASGLVVHLVGGRWEDEVDTAMERWNKRPLTPAARWRRRLARK